MKEKYGLTLPYHADEYARAKGRCIRIGIDWPDDKDARPTDIKRLLDPPIMELLRCVYRPSTAIVADWAVVRGSLLASADDQDSKLANALPRLNDKAFLTPLYVALTLSPVCLLGDATFATSSRCEFSMETFCKVSRPSTCPFPVP